MDSFYKTNKNYQRVLAQILKSRKISKQNKATIRSFLQRLLAENISPGRIKKYLTVLRNISGIVKADFTQYTDEDMQQILAEVNGRGLAGSTVNDYKTGLKRLMRFIQGSRFNPERYRWIKLEKKHVKKFDIAYNDLLTQEEVRQLISATRNAMYRCLISLAYESGARPSELLTLTIGSLAFAEGYTRITIRESKTFIRTIYAMDSDRYLKGWLNVHPYREDKTAPLFPSSYVSRQVIGFLIPESYNTTLKRLAKKARLEKRVYSYLLRHSRVTHLLEAGWNEVMIKKLVGHSVESRAFKVYEHLAEKQVEQYILKQRNRAKEERQALGVVATIACNFCKTENEPGADFCVHCNRAISMKGLLAQEDREKLLRAKELNYPALALTDHDGLHALLLHLLEQPQGLHVGVEGVRGAPGDGVDRLARRLRRGDDLVVHVRYILQIKKAVTRFAQIPCKHIEGNLHARMADMRGPVDSRAAYEHFERFFRLLKKFVLARERVVDN